MPDVVVNLVVNLFLDLLLAVATIQPTYTSPAVNARVCEQQQAKCPGIEAPDETPAESTETSR